MPADMNDYFKRKQPNSGGNNNNKTPNRPQSPNSGGNGGVGKAAPSWIFILLALVASFVFFKPFTIINSGEVGIKVAMGKFEAEPLGAGLHIYVPIMQEIIPINTKTRLITYSNTQESNLGDTYKSTSRQNYDGGLQKKPAIKVKDKRNLVVSIDIAVQYRLKAKSAPFVISTLGLNWEENIINSKVRKIVRNVLGQYTAEETAEKRAEINKRIEEGIKKDVDAQEGQPVELISVELRNINLPPEVQEQINKVQMAKQQKERATIDAEKKAAEAEGIAQKNRIEAQGKADQIRIEAEEQAKANSLISASLTPELLQLEQIKTQGKFNEALKVNKDAKIFLTPGGAVPNIWVDTKGNDQRAVSAAQ